MKKTLKVIIFAGLFFFFALLLDRGLDPDLGWHLRIGQQIVYSGQIPQLDNLTHTMAGYEWVDHEWLINSVLYFLYANGLWLAAVLGFSLLIAWPFWDWLKLCSNWWQVTALLCAAAALSGFLFVRPAVISLFLFAWLYSHLNANFDFRLLQKRRFLAKMALFFFFWANLHAGFVAGLFLLGLFIFWDFVYSWKSMGMIDWTSLKYDIVLMSLCALAPLLNPYGLQLYGEVLRIMQSKETHIFIAEWLPGIITPNWITYLFWVPFLWVMYRYRKVLDLREQFIAFVFLMMYWMSQRQFMQLVIVAMPVFLAGLYYVYKEFWTSKVKQTIAIGLAAVCLLYLPESSVDRTPDLYYPEDAVGILREYAKFHPVSVFNDYNWGGFMSWELPEVKHYIDGRMPHWKLDDWSLMADYMKAYFDGDKTMQNRLVDKYQLNTALLSKTIKPKKGIAFADNLKSQGWQTLYENDQVILLVLDK